MKYECKVSAYKEQGRLPAGSDVVILAAGFEDRAKQYLSVAKFEPNTHCVLIQFDNDLELNVQTSAYYAKKARETFGKSSVTEIAIQHNEAEKFQETLNQKLDKLPPTSVRVWVDISGMPTYVIFAVLNCVRSSLPFAEHNVIYTSAEKYFPTHQEYQFLKQKNAANDSENIEYVPKSMALEMDKNLNFAPFRGYRTGGGNSCLALFAGYEVHRSTGVIEETNPSLLLLLYGRSPVGELNWRTDLSHELHKKFEDTRKCAVEHISTQSIEDSVDVLEEYYVQLVDEYDMTISPICSKLQTVGAYLFWEKYREVQVTFPLPIGYNPDRRPLGIEKTYVAKLPSRNF